MPFRGGGDHPIKLQETRSTAFQPVSASRQMRGANREAVSNVSQLFVDCQKCWHMCPTARTHTLRANTLHAGCSPLVACVAVHRLIRYAKKSMINCFISTKSITKAIQTNREQGGCITRLAAIAAECNFLPCLRASQSTNTLRQA